MIAGPLHEAIQGDGRIRRWRPVPEAGDAQGNLCAMTIEHARVRADILRFSFEPLPA